MPSALARSLGFTTGTSSSFGGACLTHVACMCSLSMIHGVDSDVFAHYHMARIAGRRSINVVHQMLLALMYLHVTVAGRRSSNGHGTEKKRATQRTMIKSKFGVSEAKIYTVHRVLYMVPNATEKNNNNKKWYGVALRTRERWHAQKRRAWKLQIRLSTV